MLFMPSPAGIAGPVFSTLELVHGRLTNLDLRTPLEQEFIQFQYNPAAFTYEREFNWGNVQWRGSELGGDVAYLNSGPHTFDLTLEFVSEPSAQTMESLSKTMIAHPELRVNFEGLEATIKDWMLPVDGKGRPSRINVILGPRFFNGIILSYRLEIIEFHHDLSARHGRLRLEFQEWEPTLNMQP